MGPGRLIDSTRRWLPVAQKFELMSCRSSTKQMWICDVVHSFPNGKSVEIHYLANILRNICDRSLRQNPGSGWWSMYRDTSIHHQWQPANKKSQATCDQVKFHHPSWSWCERSLKKIQQHPGSSKWPFQPCLQGHKKTQQRSRLATSTGSGRPLRPDTNPLPESVKKDAAAAGRPCGRNHAESRGCP